jgi:hypothetical protein
MSPLQQCGGDFSYFILKKVPTSYHAASKIDSLIYIRHSLDSIFTAPSEPLGEMLMTSYWSERETKALETVSSFEGAADLAVSILSRMNETGREIIQLCGPMSTGGLGNLAANMARFSFAIERAIENGLLVFNQIPFQQVIIRLCNFKDGQPHYNWEILEIFYRRVFESGHVHRALFLPGWESSTGAKWERDLVSRLGITAEDYPSEWLI